MTRETILEEIQRILEVLDERRRLGRPSYLTSVRKAVESLITLRLSEFVSFLDQQGLVTFDKKRNTLELTEQGDQILNGMISQDVMEGISQHFVSVLPEEEALEPEPEPEPEPEVDAPAHAPAEEAPRSPAQAVHDVGPPPHYPSAARQSPAPAPRQARRMPVSTSGWSSRSPASEPPMTAPLGAAGSSSLSLPTRSGAIPALAVSKPTAVKRYEKEAALGTGGIGQVYEGVQLPLDRRVAIKEIKGIFNYFPPSRRHEILDQIKEVTATCGSLGHPFIVQILDLVLDEEYPYIVMEYCPQGSLRERIKEEGRLEPKQAIQLFVQVAEALAFAHRQEVMHRNLKPENILFDQFGNAKISDFGMIQIVDREDQKGQFYMGMGTVAYMSPEQFQDPHNISVQSDLYSLGIILYEMLTGKLPGRRSPMPSEYFDDIPCDLDDIFDRMTMDFLDHRYSNLDEILLDLYKSPSILALLRRRGPSLFTDTDLSSLPELPETVVAQPPRPAPPRSSPAPRAYRRGQAASPPPEAPRQVEQEERAPMAEEATPSRSSTPAPERRSSSSSRYSDRLRRMGGDLFGED